MTADELARLELARRAFAATRPNEGEVSAGVRRARLALRRSKLPRKSWFGKGLVLVTLAIGGLAYAKPQGLGEVIARIEQAAGFHPHGRFGNGVGETHQRPQHSSAPTTPSHADASAASMPSATAANRDSSATAANRDGSTPTAPVGAAAPKPSNGHASTRAAAPTKRADGAAALAQADINRDADGIFGTSTSGSSTSGSSAGSGTPAADNVSSWGRVSQALAAGDEQGALSALNTLSDSDDPRTRDKADLGRAQLLLAHGQQEQGCALARQLIHRRAGGRIERQALTLLKSCTR